MQLCTDCGHRPSDRYGDGERECGCKCHRIADLSPDLVIACGAAMAWLTFRTEGRIDLAEMALRNAAIPIRNAIAAVEGKQP